MYYYLVSSVKTRLVDELKDSFARHPIYSKIVPFIQNKFSFEERPTYGIVLKGSSANKIALSADNFLGTKTSHVMLSYVGQPTYPIEWVREDPSSFIPGEGFPTKPGVYYIEILKVPENSLGEGLFVIDPLLTVSSYRLLLFNSGIEKHCQITPPPLQGTLRIYENGRRLLVEGQDYTVNYSTGAVTLSSTFRSYAGSTLVADYRYVEESKGPYPFRYYEANTTALPGVVLAFGNRAQVGDKVALVVYEDRVETAQTFGGRFDVTIDLDVLAVDPIQMGEIADFVMMTLWAVKRERLASEGLQLMDVSIGGEVEETYDETGQTFYYMVTMSAQFRTDWELDVPLPLTISNVTQDLMGKSDVGLMSVVTPTLVGRFPTFENLKDQ